MAIASAARSMRRGLVLAVCAALIGATASLLAAPAAHALTGIPNTGSIVYIKDKNVWAMTPDGGVQHQITTDGATATSDGTGDARGYSAVSESDTGTIVAVREQRVSPGYDVAWLYVMDRNGHLIRKFKPLQYGLYTGNVPPACVVPASFVPMGISDAVISPDGMYVGYTAVAYTQTDEISGGTHYCDIQVGFDANLVAVDGTNNVTISGDGNTGLMEVGEWIAPHRLLVDRSSFGDVEIYYDDAPSATATGWTAPSDLTDTAYRQPDVRGSVLVTHGYSMYTNQEAMRLWTYSSLSADPSPRCDYNSPNWVSGNTPSDNAQMSRPSLAPDGSAVVWEDAYGDPDQPTEGIYIMSTDAVSNNCATEPTLLVQGGSDPFWTPASVYPPPTVTFTGKPATVTRSTSATLTFTQDQTTVVTTLRCSLDGAAASTCTSPVSVSGLADGVHSFTVTATNANGTSAPATASWRVDTKAPSVALTAPTAAFTLASSLHVTWKGSDTGSGVAKYQLRYERAPYNGGFAAWVYPSSWQSLTGSYVTAAGLAAGYDYCYSVRAVDKAGNASAWTASRCTAIPLDDRALATSTGWSRQTGSAYYLGTATASSSLNAKLTRTSVALKRIAVLATTCSTCGKVAVYVGSVLVGTVNLASSTTHNKVLFSFPVFSLRTVTVTLKVVTSGRLVRVDGLGVSRT